jgi:ABC-type transporter MlaC component
MRDVGYKGGRKPKHIVITHSFAGGSGSGMVLPVLQQVRRTFGGEAIIWVLSVGGGDAERKVASYFNTPFITSDILQAHYDGIHAILDPIEFSQWNIFKSGINRHREAMVGEIQKLVHIISGEEPDKKDLMKTFEQHFDEGRNKEHYINKKHGVYDAFKLIIDSEFPVGYSSKNNMVDYSMEQELVEAIELDDFHSNIEAILPSNREETKLFNKWCEIQEPGGIRPALSMWMNWLECETDPLGFFIQGREKLGKTVADTDAHNVEQQFVPSLTSDHLDSVLSTIYTNQGLKHDENRREAKKIADGLLPLCDVLDKSFSGTPEQREKRFDEISNILESYGNSIDQYNNLRENLTGQVMSMAGASSDARVKSIVVSNSHLELGVNSTPDLNVSGSTYTVYNSVIFDLMLNIIGPRLPTESGVFINTDDEEFDQQDLITHTLPPMIVGLLNQRDSASLTEPPLVTDRYELDPSALDEMLNSMFTVSDVCEDLKNPLACFISGRDEIKQLFLSFFGSRYLYLLQHDPNEGLEADPPAAV